MNTRFDPWKQTAFRPGTGRFSCQLAVSEEHNLQATKIHDMLVTDLAGMLPHREAAKGATEIRPRELPRRTGCRKNDCLFFERSKFRTPRNEAQTGRYTLMLSVLCSS